MTVLENEIAIVPPKETALAVFTAENGLDPYLKKILDEIEAYKTTADMDMTKERNRKAVASMSYKLARSKTALDNAGKVLVDELKALPRKVDSERKRVWDLIEKWQEEVREPLTEWEKLEAARIQKIGERIADLKVLQKWSESPCMQIDDIKEKIDFVKAVVIDDSFAEFKDKAEAEKNKAIVLLKEQLENRIVVEAEYAERNRLEEEARAEAEKKAEAERIEREKRIAEEAKRQAEEAAAQKAKQEKEAAERRELQLQLAAEKAKREALEAEERAKRIAQETEERLKRENEDRLRKQEEERLNRYKDEQNKMRIYNEIYMDLLGINTFVDEKMQEIYKGVMKSVAAELCSSESRIRHVKVVY
jgi:hypothetical protein